VAFERTCALWKRTHGVAYQVHGGMYRGEPPPRFFAPEWTWAPGMLPGKNAHLAGIMGASSTFQQAQQLPPPYDSRLVLPTVSKTPIYQAVDLIDPVSELKSSAAAPPAYSFLPSDTPDAFLAQNPKSTTKGVNSNPPIKGYVFGKGRNGWGYYKLGTEEAYNVLQSRLDRQIETVQANMCPSCFCCGIMCFEDSSTKKLRDLEKAKADLAARRDGKQQYTESESDSVFMGAACGQIIVAAACGSGPAVCGGASCGHNHHGGGCGGGSCGAASCGAPSCGAPSCGGASNCGGASSCGGASNCASAGCGGHHGGHH